MTLPSRDLVAVIGNPKGSEIERWHDMLRPPANGKAVHDAKGIRIDHCNAAGRMVRDINARQSAGDWGLNFPGSRSAVKIFGFAGWRHCYESGLRTG